MKAIRVTQFGEPQVMKVAEVAEPSAGPGQVVVALQAVGVNPVDAYCRAGAYSWVSLPFTPGFDGAGIVKSVGPDVKTPQVGDRVYTTFTISGTYAEEVLCDTSQVYPLPDTVGFDEGAGVGIPYQTAYRGLIQRCRAQEGETVLVHGASGAVGIAAMQFALVAGCTVIGTAGTEQGRALVAEQGAHHVVDHHDDGHFDSILNWTDGRGVDVIIEPVSANIRRDISILATGGRIAVIGDRTPIDFDAHDLTSRDGSLLGTGVGNLPPSTREGVHSSIFQGLSEKTLKPVVGMRVPLAEAARAHEALSTSGTVGKIVLVP